jgi:hypothetical protein
MGHRSYQDQNALCTRTLKSNLETDKLSQTRMLSKQIILAIRFFRYLAKKTRMRPIMHRRLDMTYSPCPIALSTWKRSLGFVR